MLILGGERRAGTNADVLPEPAAAAVGAVIEAPTAMSYMRKGKEKNKRSHPSLSFSNKEAAGGTAPRGLLVRR